ncbi:hypothetical protein ABPG77_002019 [Micractinium sp. CCAP 211/92]
MGDRYVQITRPNDAGDYAGSPRGYRPGHDPGRVVYVGQLRYDTDEKTVRRWFEAYGPVVSVKLIFDKETGRSKGFGFVTFEDERDARDALNDAGGRELDGATIKVNIAHGPGSAPGFFGRGGRGGGRNGNFYGGRGGPAPYRPPFGKGVDRRVIAGGPGADDRYSPGRYSPRGRSRSRSPVRRHDRDERYDEFRGRGRSPSRSRSRSRSQSRSRSPRRASASPPPSRSRSRSRSRTRSPSEQRFSESPGPGSARGGDQAGAHANGHAHAHPPAPAVPPPVQSVPGGATGAVDLSPPGSGSAPPAAAPAAAPAVARPGGAKPPPSAEAIKKELLRLRRQEQELGGKVRALQEEVARKDRQLAKRDADLAEAHAQLHHLQPQLEQYKHWVAELLDGAAKLAGSRVKLAAAQEEAKEQEGRLADLHRSVLQEAERAGLDLPGLAGQYDPADEDAAWEQLAATIQESERAAGGAGEAGGAEQQQQGPGADDGLQAAMQEAAMEEDEPAAGSGWERAPAQTSGQDQAAGGRFAGVKLTVPAA